MRNEIYLESRGSIPRSLMMGCRCLGRVQMMGSCKYTLKLTGGATDRGFGISKSATRKGRMVEEFQRPAFEKKSQWVAHFSFFSHCLSRSLLRVCIM